MSFDIGVWSSSKRITSEQAGHIYEQLCEEDQSSEIAPQVDAGKRVAAFLRELERKYPAISSNKWTDETIDDCPWSCDFDVTEVHVVMSCVWSWADDIAAFVQDLAYRHELVYYDPQSDTVRLPGSLGGVRPEPAAKQPLTPAQKRKIKKEAQQEVGDVIDRAIGAVGFEKRSWPGLRGPGQGLYVRQINPETLGLVRWYDLSGSGSTVPRVTVWIGVRNQLLEAALAEQKAERFHPYWPPSVEVEIGRLMEMTQRFYEFEEEEQDEELAEQLAAAVRDHAIPYMEAHASLARLAARIGQPYFHWNQPSEERAAAARRLLKEDGDGEVAAADELAPKVTGLLSWHSYEIPSDES